MADGQMECMKGTRAAEGQRHKPEIRVSPFAAPLQQGHEKEPIGKAKQAAVTKDGGPP